MLFKSRIAVVCFAVVLLAAAIGSPFFVRAWRDFGLNQMAEQCRRAREQKDWDTLGALAVRWTDLEPTAGEAWMYRGQAAMARQDWSAAAEAFWKVPDSDALAVSAMTEVSKLCFGQLDDPLKGVAACERILGINPKAAGPQEPLIGFYATTLQREKLSQQIQAAIEAECEPREAYIYWFLRHTLGSSDSVQILDRWLIRYPDEESFLVARVLQQQDSTSESAEASGASPTESSVADRSKIKRVEELRKRFPDNMELLAFQGDDCIATGDVEGAVSLLSQAPHVAREDARFWRLKGWVHEMNNELDDAATNYQKGLELHPVDWNTMNRLAVVERRRQNPADVERLTQLVERANNLRLFFRKNAGKKNIPPEVFFELASYYHDCSDRVAGPALERRLGSARPRRSPNAR